MTDASIITAKDNGRATVTLNRPDVHNAFDDELIARLAGELEKLDQDPDVGVVVLAGEGKSFSAGADLNWMRRVAEYCEAENLAGAVAMAQMLKTLHGLSKPTIARVHGAAFGGGVGLVACCDIAFASEAALFSLSETKLGLVPATISPYVITAIGERQSRRYMLSAERFDALEAMRIGLVHGVVAAADLDQVIDEMAATLLANGPKAMAEVKEMIVSVAGRPIDDDLANETAALIARIRVSEEGREGLASFLEKRKPDWGKC
ncbi:MAG: enoyl-CoA hydratase/isomerase family protein [Proteobacteria bacterium]|nr:enoyl-CoA hydratase/isomerase family protein [Pseudomonadota bacterium]